MAMTRQTVWIGVPLQTGYQVYSVRKPVNNYDDGGAEEDGDYGIDTALSVTVWTHWSVVATPHTLTSPIPCLITLQLPKPSQVKMHILSIYSLLMTHMPTLSLFSNKL